MFTLFNTIQKCLRFSANPNWNCTGWKLWQLSIYQFKFNGLLCLVFCRQFTKPNNTEKNVNSAVMSFGLTSQNNVTNVFPSRSVLLSSARSFISSLRTMWCCKNILLSNVEQLYLNVESLDTNLETHFTAMSSDWNSSFEIKLS